MTVPLPDTTIFSAHAVDPDGRWAPLDHRRFSRALTVAAMLHAAALVPVSISLQSRRAGDRSGSLEGIAVEVIDATEFGRRITSLDTGRSDASAHATDVSETTRAEPEEPAAPPSPQIAQQPPPHAAAQFRDEPALSPRPDAPVGDAALQDAYDLVASALREPIVRPPTRQRSGRTATPVMPADLDAQMKAALAHKGRLDDYSRLIARILMATKPVSPGLSGRLLIEFLILPDGRIDQVSIKCPSRERELDQLVLASLRDRRFPQPPSNTTLEERTFSITYSYR